MRQSDLVLDKYWVTYSDYFRIATAVALGMGITYGKLLFYHGISEGRTKKIQIEGTKTAYFMTTSIIPFQMIVVAQI